MSIRTTFAMGLVGAVLTLSPSSTATPEYAMVKVDDRFIGGAINIKGRYYVSARVLADGLGLTLKFVPDQSVPTLVFEGGKSPRPTNPPFSVTERRQMMKDAQEWIQKALILVDMGKRKLSQPYESTSGGKEYALLVGKALERNHETFSRALQADAEEFGKAVKTRPDNPTLKDVINFLDFYSNFVDVKENFTEMSEYFQDAPSAELRVQLLRHYKENWPKIEKFYEYRTYFVDWYSQ